LKTNFNDIDELLVKYLTGEAAGEERAAVQQWLDQDEKNRQYYDHFRLIWEESLQLAATVGVDEDAAWQRFQQRTQQPAAKRPAVFRISWVRIAATVIIVSGLAWMAYFLLTDSNQEIPIAVLETTNDVKTDTLPDGSFVTINAHSSLSYPGQFTGSTRNVQLTGEGFFKVKPNKKKPFIVNAGDNVTVEVLGTAFNVKNRGDSIEIIVEEGRVMVKYQDKKIGLKKGEIVVIKKGQQQAQKKPVEDALYNYYRTHAFICDETPVWKLVKSLNEVYNTNIIIENQSLNNKLVSAVLEMDSPDRVLEVVALALDFKIIKTDSAILLR
jgi:ferric-dicitrate binding protein FerR (iron transport regulator)